MRYLHRACKDQLSYVLLLTFIFHVNLPTAGCQYWGFSTLTVKLYLFLLPEKPNLPKVISKNKQASTFENMEKEVVDNLSL